MHMDTMLPRNTLQIDVPATCGCGGRGYCGGLDVNLTMMLPLITDYGRTSTLAPQAVGVANQSDGSSVGHAPCPHRTDDVLAGIDEVLARQGLRRTGEFRDQPEPYAGWRMAVVERLYGPRQWSGYYTAPTWARA